MKTIYSDKIDKNNVLPNYPRPQLKRDSYINLNGYWDYAISSQKEIIEYDGKILVPFSPESELSKVNRFLKPNEYLIYNREVKLPKDFNQGKIILHFGAVDQTCEVYVNSQLVKTNVGGFMPFSIDITDYVESNEFDLRLIVTDLTDTSYHFNGKQRINRGGIFYTPQSGIWQTVWLESVPNDYLRDLKMTANIDTSEINFSLEKVGEGEVNAKVFLNNRLVGEETTNENKFNVFIDDIQLWSPETPVLYDIEITYNKDKITSYIGMRKVERKMFDGKMLFFLNNKPYFVNGVLDQGYFPDGLLTPPTYEAIKDDILYMKELGFNMIRKHIKIEPHYFYEQCDRLGMLVIQDMINGGTMKNVTFHHALNLVGIHLNDKLSCFFGRRHKKGKELYYQDLKIMLDYLKNVTSLVVWVPFNEAWGQFSSKKVTKMIYDHDNTRLVDHASGWSDQRVSDFASRHIYFKKVNFRKSLAKKRILALTEFGGYSLPIVNHQFDGNKVFGYKKYNTKEELQEAYENLYINEVLPQIKKGLSVLVYTQLSDVEDEVNGFITYDRKIKKMDTKFLKTINQKLEEEFSNNFIK